MLIIEESTRPGPAARRVEIVERKGLGHPDSICDAIAEASAVALVRAYREALGFIPHFNLDKALLVAGRTECRFGGGRVLEPMRLVVGDRATLTVAGTLIPAATVVEHSVREWFRQHLPHANVVDHIAVQVDLKPGSPELRRIMGPGARRAVANDTSATVGFAPLSATENLVLEAERYLNGFEFKSRFRGSGEDVKVMAVRIDRRVSLTIAMPLVDSFVPGEPLYFAAKEAIVQDLQAHLFATTEAFDAIEVTLNALDEPGHGVAGVYLSVIGTSAEAGDSGEVGRGNGISGLISPGRPTGAEAVAGKNPVCHVGKIYSFLARRMAERIQALDGVAEATLWLVSRIGTPIDEPQIAAAKLVLDPDASFGDLRGNVSQAIEAELADVNVLCEKLARGELAVC
jgi:S-adenosylmethionine synthetase